MLTAEQRIQLGALLAPIERWRLGAPHDGALRWVDTYFAPRLFGNGEIDFIAPDLAGGLARTVLAAGPEVVFLVADPAAGRWLAGFARAMVVEPRWEVAELRTYLTWRSPGLIDELGETFEIVLFRPTYLQYGDRRRAEAGFVHSCRQPGPAERSFGASPPDGALSPEQSRILAEINSFTGHARDAP